MSGGGRWARWRYWALWVVVWASRGGHVLPPGGPLVHLEQGTLRGRLAPDGSHHQYFGIPYASSGKQYRFQAPGPPPRWSGEFQAIDEHVRCPQVWGPLVVGREDCLVLNVYGPAGEAPGGPRPVMVFVHGGAFKEGAGARLLYGPGPLVARGVLLVTLNYRLGALGFLGLGTRHAPGNTGLKDQAAALRWVRDNIRAFGGDPHSVTLFGESAGGASVSYHVVSRASRGLFHRAVLQSGSATAPWAAQRHPLRAARRLAAGLGYNATDPQELYDIFMNETVSNLITAELPRRKGALKYTNLPFVPCVEKQIDGVEPFITDAPFDILSRGEYNEVPVIVGSNNEEGYFFAALEDDRSLSEIDFEQVLPVDLDFPSPSERRAAARELKRLYLGEEEVSWASIVRLSRVHGDPFFTFPALVETELLLATGSRPVYSYIFEHDGWRNFPKLVSGPRYWLAEGATHADELFYLFSLFPVPNWFDTDMIDTMTLLWTNFAKYGTPGEVHGVRWSGDGGTLRVGGAPRLRLVPRGTFREEHMRFWSQLYRKYRTRHVSDLH